MKAVVYKGPFELSVEEVADPKIEQPLDAIIRITTANICGSDLHPTRVPPISTPAWCSDTRTWESSRRWGRE